MPKLNNIREIAIEQELLVDYKAYYIYPWILINTMIYILQKTLDKK